MVDLQILNKILETKDPSIIFANNLTEEHFISYQQEFQFLMDHYNKYNQIPDKETFVDNFKDFQLLKVEESDEYLLDTLLEEHLYYKSVGVIQEVAKLLKTDSNQAVEYLLGKIPELQLTNVTEGTDIIQKASERFKTYQEKQESDNQWYIETGFPELDTIINGWARGEELVVFFARTGQGKSWVLTKTLSHAWKKGNRVGFISPEMGPDKIGYRFDTLMENFSNTNLVWGREEKDYDKYIKELETKENPFIVATPKDFNRKITVSKVKQFIKVNKLDIIGIDGITYMTDERYKRGDSKTTSLTNISEDLISLSVEMRIPIIIVVQSNRTGVIGDDEGTPELESIRDSDGIAQNATKVISLRQTGLGLEFGIKKHRDGELGGKLIYHWDIDKGRFNYIPSFEDSVDANIRSEKIKETRETFTKEITDVF